MSISTFSLRLLAFFTFTSDVKRTVGVRHETSMSVQILETGALLENETDPTNHSKQDTGKTLKTCGDVEGATQRQGALAKLFGKCKCIGYSQSVYCEGKPRYEVVPGRYFNMKQIKTARCGTTLYCSADALVVIDVQHCFTDGKTDKDGSYVPVESGREDAKTNRDGLQNPRGDKPWKKSVVEYVQTWVERQHPIVLLQDFHNNDHVSFVGNEEEWTPGMVVQRTMNSDTFWHSNDGKAASRNSTFPEKPLPYYAPVFPKHCINGREESRLVDGLCKAVGGQYDQYDVTKCTVNAETIHNVKVVQKGTHERIDSFGGIYDNRLGYIDELAPFQDDDLAKRASWGVLEWLNGKKVKSIEAIGIADDYCVKNTVLDLKNEEKAKMIEAQAIPLVEVNSQYTYGIMASLGNGVNAETNKLKADLKKGGVKVRLQRKA